MTYDQWKTTPPDYLYEEIEQPCGQVWFERWLDDMDDDAYIEALAEELRAASGSEAPAGNRPTVWEPAQ